MGFGFLPNEGQPDFDALLKKFSEMGVDSNALAGAKNWRPKSICALTSAGKYLARY